MKKTMVILMAAFIIGLLIAPAAVQAQRANKIKEADGNGDGQVTLQELQAVLPKMKAERFKKLDKNNDGVITPADNPKKGNTEKQDKPQQNDNTGDMQKKMKDADKNGDKKISLEEAKTEFPKMDEERFKKMDANKDGFLSKEDRQENQAIAGGVMLGHFLVKMKQADTNNDQQLSYDEVKAEFPHVTEEKFKAADKDGNGQLTKEELRQMLVERLKAADTNEDGKLSLEEAKTAFPKINDEVFAKLDRNGDGFISPEDRKQ